MDLSKLPAAILITVSLSQIIIMHVWMVVLLFTKNERLQNHLFALVVFGGFLVVWIAMIYFFVVQLEFS